MMTIALETPSDSTESINEAVEVFDDKNYDDRFSVFTREAVRAIILRGDLIALVKSDREGYYKFPGGGIEPGETHVQTLTRETFEETGLTVLPLSISEFGEIIERRRSIFGEREIFEQRSYYYYAQTAGTPGQASPQGYEAELGYHLEYTDIPRQAQTQQIARPRLFPAQETMSRALREWCDVEITLSRGKFSPCFFLCFFVDNLSIIARTSSHDIAIPKKPRGA